MKKFLLSLIVGLSCVALQAEPVVETLTIKNFTFGSSNGYQNVEYTSQVTGITYKGNTMKPSNSSDDWMQFRTGNNKEAGLVATANPKGYQIVSVKVTPKKGSNRWDVYGKNAAYEDFKDLFDTNKAGTAIGNGTSTSTVTPSDKYSFFGFRANGNAIYIQKIEITYELGGPVDTREECGLAFTAEEFTANIGGENEFPTLKNPNDLAVTYDSENPAVAAVDENGNVEPLAEGTTKITATFAGNDTYKAGSVFYTLTVVDPNKPQPDAVLNVEAFDITTSYKIYTYSNNGVTYKAKAYSSNGMQVNSSASSSKSAHESGIASVENTNNLVIKQIVVNFFNGTSENIVISMSNEPNSATDNEKTAINVAESAVAITGTGSGKVYTYTPEDNYKYFALKSTSTVQITSIEIYYKEKPAAPVIKDGDVEIAESIEFEGDSKVVYLDLPEGVNAYYKFEVAEEATPAEAPRRAAHTPAEGFTKYVHADGITLTDNGTLHVYTEKDGAVSETRKVAVSKTGDTTAIEAIEADTTAPVEYFNLQGIRVENPENGLYIRRQGSKTTKVLVK